MQELIEFTQSLAGVPPAVLMSLAMISGFGLAAYAIYAVLTATKGER